MSDTILAQFETIGEERLKSILQIVQAQMIETEKVALKLGAAFGREDKEIDKVVQRTYSLSNAMKLLNQHVASQQREQERINAELAKEDAAMLKVAEAARKLAEAEKQRNIRAREAEIARLNRQYLREEEALRKVALAQSQISAAPLGKFLAGVAGGADKLLALETNAYNATRQSVLMSQMLVAHPIKTLREFSAQANKAAIAGQYFKEQLQFIASSRFGSILIWSAIFGSVAAAIRGAINATIDMDNAVHRAASAFTDTGSAAQYYDSIQRTLTINAATFGKSVKDSAELMWELKSAGLSASQTFAGMEAAQKLVIAGAEDLNQSSRLLAGLYKTFGDEVAGASSEQERFAEIAGTVAFINLKSQATIDSLMQSYKYAAGISKSTGVSFNELSAAIAVANNAMLYGSTAGTGLAQAILSAAKNYRQLAKDVGIALDPNKPLNFSEFVHQVAQNQDLVNKKISEFGKLSESINVRGLRAVLALAQNTKEYDEILARLNEGNMKGFLDLIADQRMNTFSAQWDRLAEGIKNSVIASGALETLKVNVRAFANVLESYQRLKNAAGTAIEAADSPALNKMAETLDLIAAGPGRWMGASMDRASKFLLEKSKELERSQLETAAAAGDVRAQAKLEQIKEKLSGTFDSLLSEEQKYELALLQEGRTLEQQIAHKLELRDLAQASAVDLARTNAKEEDIQRQVAKSLEAQRALNNLTEEYARRQEKLALEQADQAKAAQELATSLAAVERNTPADKILKMHQSLKESYELFRVAQGLTKDWHGDAERLAKDFVNMRNIAKIVEESFSKVVAETNKIQSIGGSLMDALVGADRAGEARSVFNEIRSIAEDAVRMAPNAQGQADAYAALIPIYKDALKYGFENPRFLQDKIIDAYRQQLDVQKTAQEEAAKQYRDARTLQPEIEKTVDSMRKGVTELQTWQTSLEKSVQSSDMLRKNFERVAEVMGQMGGMKMPEMPTANLMGGTGIEDMVRRQNERGEWVYGN